MMKRIMKTGVTAVALAASALLATPANAQLGTRADLSVSAAELRGGAGDFRRSRTNFRNEGHRVRGHGQFGKGHQKVYLNEYGQTPQEVKYLIDQAIYECDCQLKLDAAKYGYADASFRRTPHVEQIGPRGFAIKGRAKLFDGYDYSRQRYDCVVRKGKVKRSSEVYPVRNAKHQKRRRGYGYNTGWSFSFGNVW